MGLVRKQSTTNLFYLYIGLLFGALTVVFLYPNIFNENPENLGLLQIIVAYSSVISTFTLLGSPKVLLRFFPLIDQKDKLLSLVFYMSTFGYLLFFAFFGFFKSNFFNLIGADSLLKSQFNLVLYMIVFLSYFEILAILLRSLLNATLPIFLNEIFRKGFTIFLLLILFYEIISFDNFLVIYIIQYLFMSLILLKEIKKKKKKFKLRLTLNFSNINIKEILKYGFFVLLGGASAMLVSKLDMMMIAKFLSLEQVAYYSIAFYMGNAIGVPARAIGSISAPLIARSLKERNISEVNIIYSKSSLNQIILGTLLFILVWINIDDLFYFLPEKFQGGRIVVLFIALAQLFNISTGVNGLIITNSKYYSFDLYANILLLVLTFITNFVFIPDSSPLFKYGIFGINGAAFATALSIFVFNLTKMIYVYIKFKIHPFSINTIYAFITAIIIFFILNSIDLNFASILNILIKSIIVLILYFISIYKFNISNDLKILIKEKLNI
jgi:O-antigen/teichoic acid export membrane protein